MAEYLELADLTNRLTDAGVKFVADRNRSGTVEDSETASYLTTAIQYAGNIIDSYLCEQIDPRLARQGNPWLKDRAVDIAAWRAAGQGGRGVCKTLMECYSATLKELQAVKDGKRIPGLTYPGPVNARTITRTPKVANIIGRRRRRF